MQSMRPAAHVRSRALATRALAILAFVEAGWQPAAQEPERFQPPAVALPPSAERAYRALSLRVHGLAALETVRYMDQFWRIAGKPGYNSSIDHIRSRLLAAGFAKTPDKGRPFVRVEEWGQTRGWDYQVGSVAHVEALESVRRLPVMGPSPDVDARVTQAQRRLRPE